LGAAHFLKEIEMVDNPFIPFAHGVWQHPPKDKPAVELPKVEEPSQPPEGEKEYQRILREAGGLESNVPIHSSYWSIRP
jgi:hypothetical protein